MEIEPEIDFQGMAASDTVLRDARHYLAQLERRFGRLIGCRIVFKAPGGHHRQGGLYEVNIHLTLPGGHEINVGRTPKLDERHGDPRFALHDAFKRARRILQDEARKLQGQVKRHEPPPLAKVTKLFPEGYGFLETDDGREIYFHRNSVLDGAFDRLAVGTRVRFVEEPGEKGPQASTVSLIGKHGLL
jgi:cold shock CspA family protein